MLDRVLQAIRERHRFVVTSHARPDGDGIGSALACGQILRVMGKDAEVVMYDGIPRIYQGLPFAHHAVKAENVPENDAVILLECDGIERSRLHGLDGQFIINIDHHVSGRTFGHVNWIDTESCAVAEMIYKLANMAGAEITREMATCLYTAVLTDTGSFCYAGTDAHTFDLAADLVRRGADPTIIAQNTYFSNPTSKMLLLGAALSNLKRDGRLAWMWVTHEDMLRTHAAEEDCEGLVNYAIAIAGVDVAVFLRELPSRRVRLSLRSKGELNVARIAERFGGGGHAHASGCTIDGPLHRAADYILEQLRGCLQSPVHELV